MKRPLGRTANCEVTSRPSTEDTYPGGVHAGRRRHLHKSITGRDEVRPIRQDLDRERVRRAEGRAGTRDQNRQDCYYRSRSEKSHAAPKQTAEIEIAASKLLDDGTPPVHPP